MSEKTYNGKDVCKCFLDGIEAREHIESRLCKILPFDFELRGDPYDTSLEIDITSEGHNDWRITPELKALVNELGFHGFWVNWVMPNGCCYQEQRSDGVFTVHKGDKLPCRF